MLVISTVEKTGIGKEIGIEKGDKLLAFDGKDVVDVLDYLYYDTLNRFSITVEDKNGRVTTCEIEKEDDETLGLNFCDDGLNIRTCHNNCIFCFVDQMPKGMRDTLYVKDDDYRQSFLCGNFVTLTNLTDKDVERIIRLHLSPLYISVHTMNGELRKKMTNNRFADKINYYINTFAAHGIRMETQVVLVKGYNDGEELEYTARQLFKYYPQVETMAVVPCGITKYRDGLTKIDDVTAEYSAQVIELVRKLNKEFGVNFILPADEFYFKAGIEVEPYEFYGGFNQIENGVGMTAKFEKELDDALCKRKYNKKFLAISGTSAYEFIKRSAEKVQNLCKGVDIHVVGAKNYFFGETVNCTGLLTGGDIYRAATEFGDDYDVLVLSHNTLKETEDVFLDGMTLVGLSQKLGKPIRITDGSGESFFNAFTSDKVKEVNYE